MRAVLFVMGVYAVLVVGKLAAGHEEMPSRLFVAIGVLAVAAVAFGWRTGGRK